MLPAALGAERYGEPLRRRWLRHHAITHLGAPERFAGVSAEVVLLGMRREGGPAPVAQTGVDASEVLALARAPWDAGLASGDLDIARTVRAHSVPLGQLAHVDTGVVSHGPLGGKARLLRDGPGPGHVPYADARDLRDGTQRWLAYRPEEMHRPKTLGVFEADKLIVPRLVGRRPIDVYVDREGIVVGHTCNVVVPHGDVPSLEGLASLLRDPALAALLALERGARLDLYPHDLAAVPVPKAWAVRSPRSLAEDWGLSAAQFDRLLTRARKRGTAGSR